VRRAGKGALMVSNNIYIWMDGWMDMKGFLPKWIKWVEIIITG
jgi:hypothetical protein